MSEKKPSEVILDKLALLEKEIQALKQPQSTTSTHEHSEEPQEGHRDLDEVLACPNCRPKVVEKLKPGIEKAVLQAKRDEAKKFKKPRLCTNCGELLDADKETDCPTCHTHKY